MRAAAAAIAGRQLNPQPPGCECGARLRAALQKAVRAGFLPTLLHLRKILLFRSSSVGTVTSPGRVITEGIQPFPLLTPAGTHNPVQLRNDC